MMIRASLLTGSSVSRRILRLGLRDGVRWTSLTPRGDALARAARVPCDLLLIDSGSGSARRQPVNVLRSLRGHLSKPEVVVLSDREDPQERAVLLAAGALAVVYLGLEDEVLESTLESLLQRCRELQSARLRARRAEERFALADFASASATMRDFLGVVRRVLDVDSPLLLLGETGVGKEHLARAIHAEGPRRGGPFVAVNSGALPEALLESELFGHEEGAFTGAVHPRRGYFELAHGGSLFLDEVGEMPQHLQVKLLRALQDGRVQPVGAEHEVEVDVRVIAATNRDLSGEVAAKRFRADLFFRLNVVSLTVPPLRARHEDVPALVSTHVAAFCERFARPRLSVEPRALAALVGYQWPGNVRELINVVERAVLLCEGTQILLGDLPEAIARAGEAVPVGAGADLFDVPLKEAAARVLAAFERDYLDRALQASGGRLGEVARRAGLSPRGLYGKLRRLGLAPRVVESASVSGERA